MTNYISTRDASVNVDGATAVLDCFSADGGLYVPQSLPTLSYTDMLDLDYAARVDKTLRAFFDLDVKGVADKAYDEFDGDPAPTVKIDDNAFILELWHGQTHTSKDIPYAVLPGLMAAAKIKSGDKSKTFIPLATNGDMGKSAAEAFGAADDIELCVLYPKDGMRDMLKRELCAVDRKNVCVVGVNGSFDDIQSAVRSILADGSLNEAFTDNNIKLSCANSANIGVIVPQIAYYFSAYCDLVNSGEIKPGEKIDFIMPVGNFGGTLAGYYAAKMGLPINKLVCASSAHPAFIDFIGSGVYDINRAGGKSKAPVLGNLERIIFEISGRNAELTSSRMAELKNTGRFSVTEVEMNEVRQLFAGECVDIEDVLFSVSEMFEEYGYISDTRTATAYAVAVHREFVRPTVIVSLTNPYKMAAAVMKALGERGTKGDEFLLKRMEEDTAMEVPQSLIDVFSAPRVHNNVIEPQDITTFIRERYCKN